MTPRKKRKDAKPDMTLAEGLAQRNKLRVYLDGPNFDKLPLKVRRTLNDCHFDVAQANWLPKASADQLCIWLRMIDRALCTGSNIDPPESAAAREALHRIRLGADR